MIPNEDLLSPSIQLREFKFDYPSSLIFKSLWEKGSPYLCLHHFQEAKKKKKTPSFKLSTIFKDFVGNMKKKKKLFFFLLLPNLFI